MGGGGPMRLGPRHLQLRHSQLSGQQRPQPLREGPASETCWVGSDMEDPSSLGRQTDIWDPGTLFVFLVCAHSSLSKDNFTGKNSRKSPIPSRGPTGKRVPQNEGLISSFPGRCHRR